MDDYAGREKGQIVAVATLEMVSWSRQVRVTLACALPEMMEPSAATASDIVAV